jgi:hypothetical protein
MILNDLGPLFFSSTPKSQPEPGAVPETSATVIPIFRPRPDPQQESQCVCRNVRELLEVWLLVSMPDGGRIFVPGQHVGDCCPVCGEPLADRQVL